MSRTLGTAGKLRSGTCGNSESWGWGGQQGLGEGTHPIMHRRTQCLAVLERWPSLIPQIFILCPSFVPAMC